MGNCIYCIYHTTRNNPVTFSNIGGVKTPKINVIGKEPHFCKYPTFKKTDFVTGAEIYADCYSKNFYGECLFFDDGSVPAEIIETAETAETVEQTETDEDIENETTPNTSETISNQGVDDNEQQNDDTQNSQGND